MITKEELSKLNDLIDHKEELESLIKSFSSKYVQASIGVIALYPDRDYQTSIKQHDKADFFNNELTEYRDSLNEYALTLLKKELHNTNLKITKYLK